MMLFTERGAKRTFFLNDSPKSLALRANIAFTEDTKLETDQY